MNHEYILKINQAINYIYQNLDRNLTVEEIASHCCFSKYYFNRIFKSVVNESIYAFTIRLKLENAAFKLRTTRRSITEIAIEAGYSPSNFASSFKENFGISASRFRNQYDLPLKDSYIAVTDYIHNLKKQDDFFARINSKISIKRLGPMILEYQRFIGNYYHGLIAAWENFCKTVDQKYGFDPNRQFVGISFDDPLIADENHCIYDMGMMIDKKNCINVHRIEAGAYACYPFDDHRDNLMKAFNEILALWMPFCPYDLDDRLPLEIYHSGLQEDGKIHLEICIPIKG